MIDFWKIRKVGYFFSSVLIILSAFLLIFFKLTPSIEFTGGSFIVFRNCDSSYDVGGLIDNYGCKIFNSGNSEII